eukprot:TRINITY_DN1208_c1_g1_i1.p2 TRINITY_DN1208_c1_g1~~TRINITY_DN1208_c1_g1_i1.p2  ORF type:complete len:120 (+),score=3.40 TRINITY_DN1208_c1_g1_i1:283-642(+)
MIMIIITVLHNLQIKSRIIIMKNLPSVELESSSLLKNRDFFIFNLQKIIECKIQQQTPQTGAPQQAPYCAITETATTVNKTTPFKISSLDIIFQIEIIDLTTQKTVVIFDRYFFCCCQT